MSDLVDIVVPPESQEGTTAVLSRWLVKIGDAVLQHEPIVEIETDKVMQEIAAPVDGTLAETIIPEDAEIQVNAVLGRISAKNQRSADDVAPASKAGQDTREPETATGAPKKAALSPAVRRLIREHQLDLSRIRGSGKNGRVSKQDVADYMLRKEKTRDESTEPGETALKTAVVDDSTVRSYSVPHDNMRRRIAEHTVTSLLHTAPHVTSVFEADMTSVLAHRKEYIASYREIGVNLTLTAYFVAAAVQALTAVPEVNSRFHDDALEVFSDINIGVATALEDKGLVVPVLQKANSRRLLDIATELQRLTQEATQGRLQVADVKNGTFTISNHGVSGSLLATPIIINQPQSAILGVGKVQKRAVVMAVDGQDLIQIRPMLYVTLTIDHRALDGYQTNRFLSTFVDVIEHWGEQR